MELVVKTLIVAGLGVLELWVAIPAGLAFNLHPLPTALASGVGSILGALFVIVIGDNLRNWIVKKKTKANKKKGSLDKIWDRYGVVGLGLFSPLITGAPLGAAIGVTLGSPPKRLLLWMSLGIIIWTIILTGLATYGFAFFKNL